MTVKTPAELKTLYESISFDLQTTYTGPLGQEYAVSGTHLRLWAPTAQRVEVSLYRKGSGGEPIGTLPLERGQQGVWSIYLPGDQHGRYYTYTVTVDGISRQTGDPYARALPKRVSKVLLPTTVQASAAVITPPAKLTSPSATRL